MDAAELDRCKEELRCSMRARRAELTPQQRDAAAVAIAERLAELPELIGVRIVLGYAALHDEIDPSRALAHLRGLGAQIAYPRVVDSERLSIHLVDDPETLVVGRWGLRQPAEDSPAIEPDLLDAVVVPGVVFDRSGKRVGHGGGYYDRLLPLVSPDAIRIGLAFDEQIAEDIPCADHDARMYLIVTPTMVSRCSRET